MSEVIILDLAGLILPFPDFPFLVLFFSFARFLFGPKKGKSEGFEVRFHFLFLVFLWQPNRVRSSSSENYYNLVLNALYHTENFKKKI